MAVAGSSTTDVALAVFDDHLRRVRGVYPEVRRSYGRVAGEFLGMVFGDGPVDLGCLSACDVVGFVFEATVRYRPSTLQGVTTALRSFLRFCGSFVLRACAMIGWRRRSRRCRCGGWRLCLGILVPVSWGG